jgi:hypothetical protein
LQASKEAPNPGSAIIVVSSIGTPWQPEFGGWAFNLPRGQHCLDKWERIPEDTDILVGFFFLFIALVAPKNK